MKLLPMLSLFTVSTATVPLPIRENRVGGNIMCVGGVIDLS